MASKRNEVDLFAAVLELNEVERPAFLQQACGDDLELRARLDRYLRAHHSDNGPLDATAADMTSVMNDLIADCRVGSRVGPYKLLEQIGTGGMGVVFMAEQREPVNRTVALKIIKPGMDTQQVIARFEAERQALALMNHPNIAKVLDVGTTDSGLPYFAMELVKGIPVTEYCDEHRLDTRQRLELFVQVCRAVQHAHHKGIIHRDLKPTNVLVELHDVHPVPKVIDFGVAKATNQSLTDRSLHTGFSQMIGTPAYMSPEQAQLSGLDVDTRSDVYSLGVILYELLTGDTPFDRETLRQAGFDEMRRMIREDEPPRPSEKISTLKAEKATTIASRRKTNHHGLSATVRNELDWIVMKSLEKDRTRRYESPSALAVDVQRYLDGDAVQACPPSKLYRLKKLAYRHRTFTIATSIALFGLLTGIALASLSALQARKAESLAVSERSRAQSNLQLALEALEEMFIPSTVNTGNEYQLMFADRLESKDFLSTTGSFIRQNQLADNDRQRIERGLKFYEAFAKSNASGALASWELGKAYYRIGQLHWMQLDDRNTAISYLQKALPVFERLRSEQPDEVIWRFNQITVLEAIGHQFRVLKRANDASEYFARSHELALDLLREQPTDPLVNEVVARTKASLSLKPDVPNEEAIAMLNEALRYLESGHATSPPRVDVLDRRYLNCYQGEVRVEDAALLTLVTIEFSLAERQYKSSQNMNATAAKARKAREILLQLLDTNPLGLSVIRRIQNAYAGQALGFENSGMIGEAEKEYCEGAELFSEMYSKDPENQALGAWAVSMLNNAGQALRRFGQNERGIQMLHRSLTSSIRCFGSDDDMTYNVQSNLAMAYKTTGQIDKALPLLREIYAAQLTKNGWGEDRLLLGASRNLSNTLYHAGMKEEAHRVIEQEIEEVRSHPERYTLQETQHALLRYASTLMDVGMHEEYSSVIREAIENFRDERFVHEMKDEIGVLFPNVLANYARELLKADQVSEAVTCLEECVALRQVHAAEHYSLFDAISMLGEGYQKQAKIEEARVALAKGFEGMLARQESIPPERFDRLVDGAMRLQQFHESIGELDKAEHWRAKIEALRQSEKLE